MAMNPNYTEFKFPQIKPHPWHKVSIAYAKSAYTLIMGDSPRWPCRAKFVPGGRSLGQALGPSDSVHNPRSREPAPSNWNGSLDSNHRSFKPPGLDASGLGLGPDSSGPGTGPHASGPAWTMGQAQMHMDLVQAWMHLGDWAWSKPRCIWAWFKPRCRPR